jgi:hypothetical protein
MLPPPPLPSIPPFLYLSHLHDSGAIGPPPLLFYETEDVGVKGERKKKKKSFQPLKSPLREDSRANFDKDVKFTSLYNMRCPKDPSQSLGWIKSSYLESFLTRRCCFTRFCLKENQSYLSCISSSSYRAIVI